MEKKTLLYRKVFHKIGNLGKYYGEQTKENSKKSFKWSWGIMLSSLKGEEKEKLKENAL